MLPFGIPLLPAAVVALGGVAYYAVGKRGAFHGEMTTERQIVLDAALESCKDPDALNKLADAFAKEGLKEQASILRKRAVIRTLPPDVKKARNDAFKRGMACKDPEKVRTLAKCFQEEGATGAAANLFAYADGLSAMQSQAA